MTADLGLTALGITGQATLLVACVCGALAAAQSLAARAWVAHHAAQYETAARAMMWRVTGAQLLHAQLALATGAACLCIAKPSAATVGVLLCMGVAPRAWLRHCIEQRRTQVEAQLDTWLLMLANALKASPSLPDALRASATLVPAPLRDEVALLLREYGLGLPLDQALEHMAARLDSRIVSTAIALIVVSRNSGGNLTCALETSAASLREMVRLHGVLRAKTAEGKAQAALISLVPVCLVLTIGSLDAQFFAPLTDTTLGQMISAGAAALWLAGVLLARRIVQPEV